MFGFAASRAQDLAVARETATWWHAAAQRERERADLAEEQAKLAQDRLWRLTEALVRAAQRAAPGVATEAPSSPAEPSASPEAVTVVPPQIAAAVDRVAGKSAIMRQKFHEWLYRPDIAKRWTSGDPAQVKGVVDEICRGKA